MSPCSLTDQRGIARPQNGKCDSGAYEFVGDPPPIDTTDPDTQYLTGPVQDTLETNAFTFTGSDPSDPVSGYSTPVDELQFECRLYELELTEAPEPVAPWEPIPPELMWVNCPTPWSVPLVGEEGLMIFEVRAIDRAGNVDETPAIHHIDADTSPPKTIIVEKPPLVSNNRAATFSFTGTTTSRRPSSWSTSAASTHATPTSGSNASTRSWPRT